MSVACWFYVLRLMQFAQDGEIPHDPAAGRLLLGAVRSLPQIDSAQFEGMVQSSMQDLLMVVYLSSLTKTQLKISEKLQSVRQGEVGRAMEEAAESSRGVLGQSGERMAVLTRSSWADTAGWAVEGIGSSIAKHNKCSNKPNLLVPAAPVSLDARPAHCACAPSTLTWAVAAAELSLRVNHAIERAYCLTRSFEQSSLVRRAWCAGWWCRYGHEQATIKRVAGE